MSRKMYFPPELERRIFLHAMRNNPSIVPSLKLVAHRVRIWTNEILHEYVLLDNWNRSEGDLKHGLGPVPGEGQLYAGHVSPTFAKNVSSLCLTYNHELSAEQLSFFAHCRALSRLALWVDFSERPELTAVLVSLSLQTLSLEVEHFMRLPSFPSLSHVWTLGLTHLELIFWAADVNLDTLSFAHLPSLQHICFVWGRRTYPSTVEVALESCACLRTLVVLTTSGQWSEFDQYRSLSKAKDINIILLPSVRQATYEWVPGGSTVWDRVQNYLESQRGMTMANAEDNTLF
ncbi:hypothetical protein J3R30DRAFT_935 [Lentinula aciculospora]|uniref:F-box domain-containing protein n=1 Tax=Lentinula aciculospora TaxID=153920 RepID=A0A9W9AT19_9AGAR|nr:hypothetical protein J3R30DRAFT_935 [Lentinula aciculospora]